MKTQARKQRHTPTPWAIGYNHTNEQDGAFYIQGRNDVRVAKLDTDSSLVDEANAAHIVHCVNTHADLLAALKGLLENAPSVETLESVNGEHTFRKVSVTMTDEAIRAAHRTLLKAERTGGRE